MPVQMTINHVQIMAEKKKKKTQKSHLDPESTFLILFSLPFSPLYTAQNSNYCPNALN